MKAEEITNPTVNTLAPSSSGIFDYLFVFVMIACAFIIVTVLAKLRSRSSDEYVKVAPSNNKKVAAEKVSQLKDGFTSI